MKWEEEFEKLFEFWVSNYVYADDAFDLDLRSEIWKDELKEYICQNFIHKSEVVKIVKEWHKERDMWADMTDYKQLLERIG